jgi:hypothetical protein
VLLYLKDLKDSMKKKFLDLINIFGNVAGYKNMQKLLVFYITSMNRLRKKSRKQFHSQ